MKRLDDNGIDSADACEYGNYIRDERKGEEAIRASRAYAAQHGRCVICPHCYARHDGTTSALELHPDAPHARPSATVYVRRDADLPHSWYYSVGRNHAGYAYDEACARRAAAREVERLGIEVRP